MECKIFGRGAQPKSYGGPKNKIKLREILLFYKFKFKGS